MYKQIGPQLAFGWMTIQGYIDAVDTNTVKSLKERNFERKKMPN